MNSFEILSSLISNRHVRQGVLFAKLQPETYRLAPEQPLPTLSHLIVYVLVLRGVLKTVIDNIVHISTPEKKNLVNVKLIDTISDLRLSSDFRGYIVVISRQFIDAAERRNKTIPFHDVVSMRSLHALTLDKNDLEIITDYYHLLEKNGDPGDSPLEMSIFQLSVQLCHLKILQQIFSVREKGISVPNATRASLLCTRFYGLIERHVEREHTVGFYADALSITSHYLTKITNEFTGQSANRIITDELISRSSILLRNPDYTLQQIADRLNFFDPSSFGKFFKKHTGMTPTAYRKDSNLPYTAPAGIGGPDVF